MSQPVLLKVYGNLFPLTEREADPLRELAREALPASQMPVAYLKGDMLLLSFEGIYFPQDDFINAVKKVLHPGMNGKLDYLDLENWRMTRFTLTDGQLESHSVSLNNVLDYSGF